jgi:hypothetical protein
VNLLTGCGGADDELPEEAEYIEHQPNSILPYWEVDYFGKTMRKDSLANWGQLNADSIISGLNQRNENIKLEKIRQTGDTLFLRIKDAEFLNTEMGTSGAQQYFCDVILNLTEVKGINFVYFDFIEGDHASPGLYGKDLVADFTLEE